MTSHPPTPPRAEAYDPRHVLLVASGGGHLTQLVALRPWWEGRRRTWISFDTVDVRSRLAGEEITFAYHPTTRNLKNLFRNSILAVRVLVGVRPDLVVSTGAGVALPFFVVARILGIPTVYIEVVDRVSSRTLTGRMCHRVASAFVVQWPEQQPMYPGAHVVGALL